MAKDIKTFSDGSKLFYAQGKFDDWCVYLERPNVRAYPPTDINYFTQLLGFANSYGVQLVYDDFKQLYEHTRAHKAVNVEGHSLIEALAGKYTTTPSDKLEFEVLFTILYAAMVAVEQKANTRLGAKIQCLGVHQILLDKMPVKQAAKYSYGMKAYEISAECASRGF